jgi:hypothetical protein
VLPANPVRRKVCPWMMRYRFNALRIFERSQRASDPPEIIDQGPAPRESGEPRGTLSQMIRYRIGGADYAKWHQYLRLDGSIGGSGRPDPKWLRVGGEIWKLAHDDNDPPCADCATSRAENAQWIHDNPQ